MVFRLKIFTDHAAFRDQYSGEYNKDAEGQEICRCLRAVIRRIEDGWLYGRIYDLNNEKAILFVYPFGDQCIYNFEGFMELVKNRKYVNIYPNGYPEISEDRKSIITHPNGKIEHLSCEKLKLFIGITTGTGSFGMDEKYYEDFDEVYLLDN